MRAVSNGWRVSLVELQSAGEVRVDLVVGRHQPADARDDRVHPGVVRALALALEVGEPRRHLVGEAEPPQDLEEIRRVARDARLVALGLVERALGGEAVVARGLEVAEAELEQRERLVAVDRGRRRALGLAQRDALVGVGARVVGAAEPGLDLGQRAERVGEQRLLVRLARRA